MSERLDHERLREWAGLELGIAFGAPPALGDGDRRSWQFALDELDKLEALGNKAPTSIPVAIRVAASLKAT